MQGLSAQYRFSVTIGGELVASARDVDFGEQLMTEKAKTFYGTTRNYPVGITADQVMITSLDIKSATFWNWLHGALHDYSLRRDIVITDLDTGAEHTLIGCLPSIVSVPYNRESDEFVVQRVTLTADGIRHSEESGENEQKVNPATLGSITLPETIKVKFQTEGEWSGEQSPHIDADYSQYAGSKGRKISLEITLTDDVCDVQDVINKLVVLVQKSDSTNAPQIVRFTFAELAIDVVVKSISYEDMHRAYDGKLHMARVELQLQERYVGDTSRTTAEQKGSQIYVVTGNGATYQSIAYELWEDESMAQAIRDYNPTPSAQGPIIPSGTVLIIPPWEYAEQYQRSGAYSWVA